MERSRTIVFDLGEVLVPSGDVLPTLAAAAGVPESVFAPAYWAPRKSYDLGRDSADYWAAVVSAAGGRAEPDLLRRLEEIDSAKWSTLPAASADLLAALAGERIGLLSNAPGPLAAAVRAAPWSAAADELLFSAELGLLKPDPAIYAGADERLGGGPVVFFDDRPENVDAARAHGWEAHVWAGHDAARTLLGR